MSGVAPELGGERASCAAIAAWLGAQRVLGHFALLLGLTAILVLLGQASTLEWVLATAALVLAPLERYLALRLDFDRALFDAWARGGLDAADVDSSLVRLRISHAVSPARPFDDRISGALRLQRLYLGVMLVQTALVAASLWAVLR